jgi:DUF4097 and DUF4098 domain-containing protein YvlB
VLKVDSHPNGGVQVTGWDKDVYSVTACKAVARGSDAESLLGQIVMTIEHGTVSTKGPRDRDEWTVYLLVRVPKGANVEMETTNGPLSLYDVNGKVTARATNGPISLKNFSGDADVQAVNGPISVEGSSGNVRVRTQNGPISVALEGKTWTAGTLSADAQNGPMTLHVPRDFESSFVVEAKNHSPMSCRASLCGSARKTWDEDNRRIEYGTGPAVIRLSTVNGPVSVE